jgi:hypothetical protein
VLLSRSGRQCSSWMEKCTTMYLSRVDTELYWCETAAVGWVRWEYIRWRCFPAYETFNVSRAAFRDGPARCVSSCTRNGSPIVVFAWGGPAWLTRVFAASIEGPKRTIGMSWCLLVATRWSEHGSRFPPTQQTSAEPRASRAISVPPCAASAARSSPAAFADLTTQGPRGGQSHAAKPKGPT